MPGGPQASSPPGQHGAHCSHAWALWTAGHTAALGPWAPSYPAFSPTGAIFQACHPYQVAGSGVWVCHWHLCRVHIERIRFMWFSPLICLWSQHWLQFEIQMMIRRAWLYFFKDGEGQCSWELLSYNLLPSCLTSQAACTAACSVEFPLVAHCGLPPQGPSALLGCHGFQAISLGRIWTGVLKKSPRADADWFWVFFQHLEFFLLHPTGDYVVLPRVSFVYFCVYAVSETCSSLLI